jgi:hypothetical protein
MSFLRPALLIVAALTSLPSSVRAVGQRYRGIMTSSMQGMPTSKQRLALELPRGLEKLSIGSPIPLKTTHPTKLRGRPYSFTIEGMLVGSEARPEGGQALTVLFMGPRYQADVQRMFDELGRANGAPSPKVDGGHSLQVFHLQTDGHLRVVGSWMLKLGGSLTVGEQEGLFAPGPKR